MLAKVVLVNGKMMGELVRPEQCGKCGQCQGFDRRKLYDLPKGDWRVGEEVDIDVTRLNPLKASLLGYGIPLMGLVLFVAVAVWLGLNEAWQAAFAIAGLAASFLVLRLIDSRARKRGDFQTVCSKCEGGIHNG